MSNTIVVGYDGSDGALAAFDEALRLAGEIGGDIYALFAYHRVRSPGETAELDANIYDLGTETLEKAAARAREAGVTIATDFMESKPAEALVEAARERDARYIVVGSHGQRPLKGALVGSTANRLIHLAERPVIVVRTPGD
jgi:nucleotide-binding universal stress UspA family protein